MKTLKVMAFVVTFLVASVIVVSPEAPYVNVASDAHAGLKECRDRCFDKYARCRKTGRECSDDKRECDKDCEANSK